MSQLVCIICGYTLTLDDRNCPNCRRIALLCRRYLVRHEHLGSGGFATVFDATDVELNRRCAVKAIRYKPGEIERVEREMRSMVALSDAGLACVPTIYNVDRDDPEMYYIVMEYISGPTLNQLLSAPWPAESVIQFLETMLENLSQIHAAGIIHRDIKPENIKQPSEGSYILLDFGIAKHATDTQSQRAHTLAYAPIEQLGGGMRTTPRSDLFSLGATAYELLTQRQPPSSSDRTQTPDLLLRPSAVLGMALPPALERTIMALLALHAEDRPPDALAALRLLHEAPVATTVYLEDQAEQRGGTTFQPLIDRYGKGRIVALATLPTAPIIVVGTTLGFSIYDAQDLREQRSVETDGAISTLALTQEGRSLVACWQQITRRLVLDTGRGLRPAVEQRHEQAMVAARPDGQQILLGGPSGLVLVMLGESGASVPLIGANEIPQQVGFDPGGSLIVAAVWREVLVWRTSDGALLQRLGEQQVRVSACALAPGGESVAVAGGGSVTLYRLSDGRRLRTLDGHAPRIGALAYSPDGHLLAVGAADGVRLWRLADGALAVPLIQSVTPVLSLGFVQGGQTLAVATEVAVSLWATATGQPLQRTEGHQGRLYAVNWAALDSLVAAGDATHSLTLHERRLTLTTTLAARVGQGGGLSVAPDGTTLAIAGPEGITLWRDGVAGPTIAATLAQANGLSFSADGASLTVLGSLVGRYRTADGTAVPIPEVSTDGAIDLALSANGATWAVLDDDGVQVRQIDAAQPGASFDRTALQALVGEDTLVSVALSADGSQLAVVGTSSVGVIEIATARHTVIATVAQAVAFAPDEQVLATVDGNMITVWRREGERWRALQRLIGHSDFVGRVTFSPNSRLLASASYDGTICVWQIEEGQA